MRAAGTAVITGASAGFGEATAMLFAEKGWHLGLGARRVARLDAVAGRARELGAGAVVAAALDVTDPESVRAFVRGVEAELGGIDVLVNNAGLARGVEKIAEGAGAAWREMVETNVMGVLHTTRAVLPGMIERGGGHVVMIGSIAGHKTYRGGGVYCATKAALRPICEAIRIETLGKGIRVTSIDPGLAETEFATVRFSGDVERARKVYEHIRPLTARDVAECVLFVVERPAHVNVDEIVLMPTDQAAPGIDVRTP